MFKSTRRWLSGLVAVAGAVNVLLLGIPAVRHNRLLVVGMLVISLVLVLVVHVLARSLGRS